MPYGRVCPHGGAICFDCPQSRCRLDNRRRYRKSTRNGLFTRGWKELRAAALAAADGRCQLRLPGCTRVATTVHLRPELGGDHRAATLADVTACCHHCHGVTDAPRASRRH